MPIHLRMEKLRLPLNKTLLLWVMQKCDTSLHYANQSSVFIWCPCISMRDTWQRNPISQWCLVAPDSGWLLGARQRPLRAGEMAPLGIALHIQPLIWPGQGKVLCQQTRQGRFYSLVLTLMLLTLLHSQRRQLSVSDWHQLTQHMQNCYYLSSMQNIYRGNLRIFSKSAKKKRRRKKEELDSHCTYQYMPGP